MSANSGNLQPQHVGAGAASLCATPVASHLGASHGSSRSHRLDVLEQQLSTAGPGGLDPLPPTVSHDLIRITKRMAQDPDLVSKMSAIVAEECAASRAHWQYHPSTHLDPPTPAQPRFHRVASLDTSGTSGFDMLDTPPRAHAAGSPSTAGSGHRTQVSRTYSTSSLASETSRHSKQASNPAGFDSCEEYEEFERIFSMNFTRIGSAHPGCHGAATSVLGESHRSVMRQLPMSESQASLASASIRENSTDLSLEAELAEGGEEQSSDHSTADSPAYHSTPIATHHLAPPLPAVPLLALPKPVAPQPRAPAATSMELAVKKVGGTRAEHSVTESIVAAAVVAVTNVGAAGSKAGRAIAGAIQALWNAACSLCGIDICILPQPLSVAIEDGSCGGERASHSSRVRFEDSATRVAAGSVPGTLDIPRRLGFHRRKNNDRANTELVPSSAAASRKLDQRFMLAAGMLINASILWALANRIRPSRIFAPMVEVIQTAFFSSIF